MRTWAECLKRNAFGNRRVAFYFIRCHIPDHHWPIWICHCCRSRSKWLRFGKVKELYPFSRIEKSNSIFVTDFPSIIDLHRRFVALCRNGTFNINVFSFIEMELTQLSVLYLRIIDVISGGTLHLYKRRTRELTAHGIFSWIKWIRCCLLADPGIGEVCSVPLDHFDVCKPRHRNCFLYKQLTKMINKIIANYQENKIS